MVTPKYPLIHFIEALKWNFSFWSFDMWTLIKLRAYNLVYGVYNIPSHNSFLLVDKDHSAANLNLEKALDKMVNNFSATNKLVAEQGAASRFQAKQRIQSVARFCRSNIQLLLK